MFLPPPLRHGDSHSKMKNSQTRFLRNERERELGNLERRGEPSLDASVGKGEQEMREGEEKVDKVAKVGRGR